MADKTINQKVVIWIQAKKGQQIGRGECWDMADQALRHAGAASSTTTGSDDDYVWGDEVAIKDVLPGDVLQFRDFEIVTKKTVEVTFTDGSGYTSTEEATVLRGHHTAVVDTILGGGSLRVWEQNAKPLGRKVQLNVIATASSKPPPKTSQKSMKPASGGAAKPAKVTETVEVTVSGTIVAYRPKAP